MLPEEKSILLKSISVKGFKSKNVNACLDFAEDSLSIIYGNNGVGKTSLLNIMYSFFSQNEKKMNDECVQEIRVDYKVGNEEKNVSVVKTDNGVYDWSKFNESELKDFKTLFFGVQRGVSTKSEIIDEYEVFSFLNRKLGEILGIDQDDLQLSLIADLSSQLVEYLNRVKRRQRAFINRSRNIDMRANNVLLEQINISDIQSRISDRYLRTSNILARRIQKALLETVESFFQNNNELVFDSEEFNRLLALHRKTLLMALEDSEDHSIMRHIVDSLENDDFGNEKFRQLLFNLLKEVDTESFRLNSINTLFAEFNKKLGEGKVIKIEDDEVVIAVRDETHSIDELSSGEKHLLTMLSCILIDNVKRDLIVIDEPEISLNMNWQRDLVNVLKKLVPDAQIILATHSPSIVNDNSDCMVQIQKDFV